MKRITSRHNPLVAQCRAVVRGENRSLILLDGSHLVGEALDAKLPVQQLIVTSDASDRSDVAAIVTRAERAAVEIITVSPPVMTAITPVRTPSGIVALAARPNSPGTRAYASACPLVLIACDIQDPGNLGAIVRVAEAAGASGLVAAGMSADPFGWKVLRGSMGSALRLPVQVGVTIDEAIADAQHYRCRVAAAVPRGGAMLADTDLTGSLAVLIGAEGQGLSRGAAEQADLRVTVSMEPPVESLNAAVTAALILYEVRRQRQLLPRTTAKRYETT